MIGLNLGLNISKGFSNGPSIHKDYPVRYKQEQ
jgi:hypothetical protein